MPTRFLRASYTAFLAARGADWDDVTGIATTLLDALSREKSLSFSCFFLFTRYGDRAARDGRMSLSM